MPDFLKVGICCLYFLSVGDLSIGKGFSISDTFLSALHAELKALYAIQDKAWVLDNGTTHHFNGDSTKDGDT